MIIIPIAVSILAIVFSLMLAKRIQTAPTGSAKMNDISHAIRQGAFAYLERQYKTVAFVGAAIALIILLFLGWKMAIGFVVGAVVSALAGFVGMWVSTLANVRVAKAAEEGLPRDIKDSRQCPNSQAPPQPQRQPQARFPLSFGEISYIYYEIRIGTNIQIRISIVAKIIVPASGRISS